MAVLGATLIMTGIRSWVRKGLSADPETQAVPEGEELSWVALDAHGLGAWEIETGSFESTDSAHAGEETVQANRVDQPPGTPHSAAEN